MSKWKPIKTAPRDGTLLLLKVRHPAANLKKRLRAASHNCEGHDTPIDDTADLSRTIGFNNLDNDEQDVWMTAGWNWCNDYFTEGNGVPVLWRKFPK